MQLCLFWISYLLHGEYLLFIERWISAVYCTVSICCLLHGEYLLFIAWWISEAPCVISWLSHDSRDVISTWWRQIWRRCGPYGLYGTVWYDFILRLYCIVGPNLYDMSYADMAWICRPILWFLLFVIVPKIVACYLIFLRGSIADSWIFDPRNAFSSLYWLSVWLSVIFPPLFLRLCVTVLFWNITAV